MSPKTNGKGNECQRDHACKQNALRTQITVVVEATDCADGCPGFFTGHDGTRCGTEYCCFESSKLQMTGGYVLATFRRISAKQAAKNGTLKKAVAA